MGSNGPLVFYKNMRDGYITLQKEEKQKFRSDVNKIIKGRHKSEE